MNFGGTLQLITSPVITHKGSLVHNFTYQSHKERRTKLFISSYKFGESLGLVQFGVDVHCWSNWLSPRMWAHSEQTWLSGLCLWMVAASCWPVALTDTPYYLSE